MPNRKKTSAKSPAQSKKTAASAKPLRPRQIHVKTKVMSVQDKRTKVKKTFTIRSLHLGTHLIIAGSAIAVLLLLGYADRGTFATLVSRASVPKITVTVGLEHDKPLSLNVVFARKDDAGYAKITNGTPNPIHISTPAAWTRTEVTGAPISEVKQDIPMFGFTRWSLPPNAGIRLFVPDVPDAVFFDSPSAGTVAVNLQTVDLKTSLVNNRVVLVQKQALANLWGEEE
ncbi:hypothetical protein A3C52_05160 [Candidatus Peribacteria bacterium RIFCSPHIGHO2_02_FULL_51_15]|nr:MAG: hypothetical protein A3C52_05160 [Candidatus Peribacteria bacterium RIFCSPHIGHO2_02_FULL_51_15]